MRHLALAKVFARALMPRVAQLGCCWHRSMVRSGWGLTWVLLAGVIIRVYLTSVLNTVAAGALEMQRHIIGFGRDTCSCYFDHEHVSRPNAYQTSPQHV